MNELPSTRASACSRERVRSDAARRLGDAFAKLDALNQPALSPEEIQAEIDAARAERRAPHADRR